MNWSGTGIQRQRMEYSLAVVGLVIIAIRVL